MEINQIIGGWLNNKPNTGGQIQGQQSEKRVLDKAPFVATVEHDLPQYHPSQSLALIEPGDHESHVRAVLKMLSDQIKVMHLALNPERFTEVITLLPGDSSKSARSLTAFPQIIDSICVLTNQSTYSAGGSTPTVILTLGEMGALALNPNNSNPTPLLLNNLGWLVIGQERTVALSPTGAAGITTTVIISSHRYVQKESDMIF